MKRHTILILIITILLVGLVSFVHPITSAAKDSSGGFGSGEVFSSRSAGSWSVTGDMTVKRRNHTATLLPNGNVLVVGGSNSVRLDSAELYNPISGTWVLTDSMTIPRSSHTATLLGDGTVLVVGGLVQSTPSFIITDTVEIYDPATGTWTDANPMSSARYCHTATLLKNGKVLVAGGYNPNDGYIYSAELYDPATGLWTSAGLMSVTRYLHTATLLTNGKVLVAGGTAGQANSVTEIFDPETEIWSTTGSMGTARYNHTAVRLPTGNVLVSGGDNTNFLNSVELYDPDLGTWTGVNPMNEARDEHRMIMLPNEDVLVVGGDNAGPSYLNTAELYDEVGVWTSAGSMATARTYHTATLLGSGQVLVAGGYNGTDYILRSAELYSKNAVSGTISCLGQLKNATHTVYVDLHTSTTSPPVESVHIHCGDSYLFYDLTDGTYYVGTWMDLDDSGDGPPGPSEPHVWYEDTLGDPKAITIAGNVPVVDIDIQLVSKSTVFLPLILR